MIWDEFLRHFRFCDEEDSGLSDEEQERKGPKNRPKHTRKQIHQAKKNFLEKFKTASKLVFGGVVLAGIMKLDVNRALLFGLGTVVVLLTVSAGLICILLANSNKEK